MEVKQVDQLQRIISGYAAVIGNIDLGGDIIEPGAFTKTLASKQPSEIGVFIGHDVSSLPVGIPITLRVDGKGLYSETLVKPGPAGDDLLETARFMAAHGRPLGQSIGYRVYPGGAAMDRVNGKMVRRLKSLDVHEYSFAAGMAVMNPEALTTGVKTTGGGMYTVEKAGGKWAVMKDGKAVGEPFDTEEAAKAACDMHAQRSGGKTVDVHALPDSAFLYVEDGGQLDEGGRTVPRSKRHFPVRDEAGALDADGLKAAVSAIPEAKALGLTDAEQRTLQARARTMLEAVGELSTKTVDAAATEWQAGVPIAIRGIGYRLIDLSEQIAAELKAMAMLGEDTKTGQRMRAEMRHRVLDLGRELSEVVELAERASAGEDGRAKVALYRRQLEMLGV